VKKIIKLTESQLDKLTETRINEVSAIELANVLKDIPCTGEGIKTLISKKLMEYGFEDVNIKFLGYGKDNKKILRYIIHTEGPIFVIDAMSNSEVQPPCMEVMEVLAYTKV
tara:strand:- start:9755 stop:10087 length:333 start_codon:yes stop_codon:yes gene_type:complete